MEARTTTADVDGEDLAARLARLEALLRRSGSSTTDPIISQPARYVLAFTIGVLAIVALSVVASGTIASFVSLAAAFALGLVVALGYQLLAPILKRRT